MTISDVESPATPVVEQDVEKVITTRTTDSASVVDPADTNGPDKPTIAANQTPTPVPSVAEPPIPSAPVTKAQDKAPETASIKAKAKAEGTASATTRKKSLGPRKAPVRKRSAKKVVKKVSGRKVSASKQDEVRTRVSPEPTSVTPVDSGSSGTNTAKRNGRRGIRLRISDSDGIE